MAAERAVFLGPRIRRMRRDLGLTQAGMAADLGISASYVALLESNARPLTADMLLRIARTYDVAIADLAGDGTDGLPERLREVLRDPLFADLDIPPLHDVDVATNYPAVAEAVLRLHAAHRETRIALADLMAAPGGAPTGLAGDPVAEVRRFLAVHANHFRELEDAGTALADAAGTAGGLEALLHAKYGLRVRYLPHSVLSGTVRRHDAHHKAVYVDERLDAPGRRFQLALQLVYVGERSLLDALTPGEAMSEDGRRLARRTLANYGAAAVLMPYVPFHAAAQELRHDMEALARRFGTSFEQVAHRLTTLQRPGAAGIPFFFVRVDPAGNVSKRMDGAGFPFARHGGGCPLWSVHACFRRPGEVVTQWLELPDGERFFSIARAAATGGGAFGAPRISRAVALCCAADRASALVYAADGVPREGPTPIGAGCAVCDRSACEARAVPPIGVALLPDDHHRLTAPFGFADR